VISQAEKVKNNIGLKVLRLKDGRVKNNIRLNVLRLKV
jgi:hypothetical protein